MGKPEYTAWVKVPDNLKTKTQLGKLGLRPAKGQEPAAFFISYIRGRSRPQSYALYDMAEAVPKRKPSEAQLAALEKARAAAEVAATCQGCGAKPGYRHLRGGYCPECRVRRSAIRTAASWLADNPLFLDTETTGLESGDQIVEIAVLDAQGKVLLNTLVKPTCPMSAEAAAVHGIAEAELANAPGFADIAPTLYALLENRTVVVYNVAFDRQMIAQTARAHGLDAPPVGSWACAMELYAEFYGVWSSYYDSYKWQSLEDAAMQCGIKALVLHRAAGDAELARRVLLYVAESS